MSNTYEKYVEYVINGMIKETDINSVDREHDQVLPPWVKEINVLPNLLEYDEWIKDWGNGEFQLHPVADLQKYRNMWDSTTEHFYICSDRYIEKKYGVPEEMRRDISKEYRKRLREEVKYYRIVK